jgi:hypothetical protein
VETDTTDWSRAAGESTGRWATIRSRIKGRASVPAPEAPPQEQQPYDPRPGHNPPNHYPPNNNGAERAEGRAAIPGQRPGLGTIEWRTAPAGVAEPAVAALRRDLGGSRVVAFANPKGGVHKTTATVLAAATIGSVRGRGVVAWDDNELRGTLGLRAGSARHARTIRHLVTELAEVESHTGYALSERLTTSSGTPPMAPTTCRRREDPRFARSWTRRRSAACWTCSPAPTT